MKFPRNFAAPFIFYSPHKSVYAIEPFGEIITSLIRTTAAKNRSTTTKKRKMINSRLNFPIREWSFLFSPAPDRQLLMPPPNVLLTNLLLDFFFHSARHHLWSPVAESCFRVSLIDLINKLIKRARFFVASSRESVEKCSGWSRRKSYCYPGWI